MPYQHSNDLVCRFYDVQPIMHHRYYIKQQRLRRTCYKLPYLLTVILTLSILNANSSLAFNKPYVSFVDSRVRPYQAEIHQTTAFVSAAEYSRSPFLNRKFRFQTKEKLNGAQDGETTALEHKDLTISDKGEEASFEYLKDKIAMFSEMALPYFKESKKGRWLFAGMIGLTLLNSGVSVAFSYVGKDFWNALNSKDQEQFYEMMLKYAAALLVGSPVSVIYAFQRERLAVAWREWMTDRTIQLYSSNRVYYSLERGSEIDNPDQRITEDVRSFTAFSLQLFLTLSTSLIDLVSFSFILYSIQPQLFATIIAYALFGTLTTAALGKKLLGLNYEKLQKVGSILEHFYS